MEKKRLGSRTWFTVILFGFMGQVAWNVENMYFNTFLFNRIGGTSDDINRMVAASAATAVLTTFIMGALSDKIGKRKPLICIGYILWGVTVTVFGAISRENTAALLHLSDPAKILAVTVSTVIIMDCVMTFMGSTCNDAAFNAWLTDVTDEHNRGTVESVNAMLPIAAMVLVTVGFGAGATALGYPACFFALGALVTAAGIVGLFTVREPAGLKKGDGNYLHNLTYGFRPHVVKENKTLYILFAAQCLSAVASQVIMPYLLIYLQHYLGFDFNSALGILTEKPLMTALIALALVAVVAAVVSFGKLTDRFGKQPFLLPAVVLETVGLALIFFAKSIFTFALSAAVFGLGMLMFGIVVGASVRDYTPEDRVGAFQGVRMIFYVLLPMVIGPWIGARIINGFSAAHAMGTYLNDYGESVAVPVPELFLAAAAVAALAVVPCVAAARIMKRKKALKAPAAEQEV